VYTYAVVVVVEALVLEMSIETSTDRLRCHLTNVRGQPPPTFQAALPVDSHYSSLASCLFVGDVLGVCVRLA
jgi:hypothetical protein